jgi:hypothetical protein
MVATRRRADFLQDKKSRCRELVMKLRRRPILEAPEDATIVALDDPDARDFWVGWFDASVEEIELALDSVGPDLENIEVYFVRRNA